MCVQHNYLFNIKVKFFFKMWNIEYRNGFSIDLEHTFEHRNKLRFLTYVLSLVFCDKIKI